MMLPVYVPYVAGMLREETERTVRRLCSSQHRELTLIEMRGDDAYFQLLEGIWRVGDGAIIVEHDIEPRDDVFAEFDDCPHDWCACTYDLGYGYDWGLGCTKFSPRLMLDYPALIARAGEYGNGGPTPDGYPPKVWNILDNRIIRAAREMRAVVHLHAPVWHRKPGLANALMEEVT